MNRTVGVLATAVAGVVVSQAAVAFAADDARVAELEAKVAALEAQQAQNTKDLATTIDRMIRDAEQRSSLLAANGTDSGAGYDNGFYIKSGETLLRPGAQFQFRYIGNFVDDLPAADEDEYNDGFEVRRMKLSLDGTLFTKALSYSIVWKTEQEGGDMILEDAWARYMFADQWGVRLGQFKDPGAIHEELTSSKRQMAVDRSLMNELLSGGPLDRVQGVSLIYGGYSKDNPVAAEVAFTDGANSDNTNWTKHTYDWGVAGRIEYKVMGDWKAYSDFTTAGTKEDLLVLGAGGDWSQGGNSDLLSGNVDVQYENASGLGAYAAAVVRVLDEDATGTDDRTDYGLLGQVSYLINPSLEAFGRWDVTFLDDDFVLPGSEDTYNEFTVGFNYYLGENGSWGQRAKFTLDVVYLPDGAPTNVTGIGVLAAEEDEIVLRAQFQLLI